MTAQSKDTAALCLGRYWRLWHVNLGAVMLVALLVTSVEDSRAQVNELEFTNFKARMEQLERDVDSLRRAQAATPGGTPSSYSVVDARLAALEQDIRDLTGRFEELEFRLRKSDQDRQQFKSDVEFRLGRLEGGDGPAVAPTARQEVGTAATGDGDGVKVGGGPRILGQIPANDPVPAAASGAVPEAAAETGEVAAAAPVLPEGTPREQYAHAFNLLRQAQYAESEQAFAAFIDMHPDEPLTDNARYWLAETYYVREDYTRSAKGFLSSYEANKTGQKAPDSLLKLGMSLNNLGKTNEACATYGELLRAFPDRDQTITSKVAQERRRAGCP